MFPLVLFSTLFSPIFTDPKERHWVCNTSTFSAWYTYCDNVHYPISLSINPCVPLRGNKGYMHISYIPRADTTQLYFNLYMSFKSMELPKRKEIICRGSDDDYSFCRAMKGETVNTTVSFSYKGLSFSKGQYTCVAEAIAGIDEQMLFCLNITVLQP
ncbi:lymphocyte antigen 96 [Sorex araneus]|uniref:lymphocyte antigen 96 n=1 Tax=Sorex araneus TaxID=42254 RepID=UPI00243370D9|nr:lymphocyte antigen 96 [Sorex araneus]